MQITRRQMGRQMGALTFAALVAGPMRGHAAVSDVVVRSDSQPANLDPHQLFDVPMVGYALNTYDTLYRYEGNPPVMKPWLAKSHTASADGLTWTFTLNDGVTFHDGSPLTADDVVFSFRRVLAIGKAPAAAFLPILKPENVTAVDPHTVQFKLNHTYGPFLAAIPIVSIVNAKLIQANEKNGDHATAWMATNEAGSGAYALVAGSVTPSDRLDMARFEKHFMGWADNPHPVDKAVYRVAHQESTGVLGLLNGSVDMTDSYLPTDQLDNVIASKAARVEKHSSMRTFLFRMHNQRAPFNNINVRMAFAHAFNYDGFINDILKGYADRDPGPMPNTLWGFPKDAKGFEYDLDKAKFYLKKAQADGVSVKRHIKCHIQSDIDQSNQAAQLYQSDLSSIGITLDVVPDTWANITTSTAKADTNPDMWTHWVSTYFVDPENWIGQMYDSQFTGTWKASSYYKNPEVDDLLRKARALVDQAQRQPLYEEATRKIMADCVDVWVYNTVEVRGLAQRLTGYNFCPVGSGGEMRWLRLGA